MINFKRSEKTNYSPYGAFELKATYQRNMIFANGIVIALLVISMITYSLLAGNAVAEITPVKDGDEKIITSKDFPQPPIIINRDLPDFPNKKKFENTKEGIPKPIPDEDDFQDEITLPTKFQRDFMLDVRDFGKDGDGIVVSDSDETYYPLIDEFVKVEKLPELVYQHMPEYPRLAKKAGIEGAVWIKALVDIDGTVKKAVIYKSSGNRSLDLSAVDAAKHFKYSPAIQNNRPVAVWVSFKVEFRLN